MRVFKGLHEFYPEKDTVVTVGTFDGIHLGHRQLITMVNEIGQAKNLATTLLTFDPHPKTVVQAANQKQVELLTNLDEKLELLQTTGLETVVVMNFNRELSQLGYSEFVENILLKRLKMQFLVVGYDHAFGKDRAGTLESLEMLRDKHDFGLHEFQPIKVEGDIVSSSYIRRLISSGDVSRAAKLLGRPYTLKGIVVKGEGRGRRLSFPTANISVENHDKLLPREGVYAIDCFLSGKVIRGMVNIGYKPTFGGLDKTVEAHLFDFSGNLYGELITIGFLQRLREEKKFSDEKQLIEQLKHDKEISNKITS